MTLTIGSHVLGRSVFRTARRDRSAGRGRLRGRPRGLSAVSEQVLSRVAGERSGFACRQGSNQGLAARGTRQGGAGHDGRTISLDQLYSRDAHDADWLSRSVHGDPSRDGSGVSPRNRCDLGTRRRCAPTLARRITPPLWTHGARRSCRDARRGGSTNTRDRAHAWHRSHSQAPHGGRTPKTGRALTDGSPRKDAVCRMTAASAEYPRVRVTLSGSKIGRSPYWRLLCEPFSYQPHLTLPI